MALTIQQEPTQMNSAYTKLMYSVISTNRDQPQFKYLCNNVLLQLIVLFKGS